MGNHSKYAVISDVHANGEALRAVLGDIRQRRIEAYFFSATLSATGLNRMKALGFLSRNVKS